MWRLRNLVLAAGVYTAAGSADGGAQLIDLLPLLPGKTFEQTFLDRVPAWGGFFVGARLGDARGGLDPASVRYGLGTSARGGTLCIQITSGDGRYSAVNRYSVPNNVTSAPKAETHISQPKDVARFKAEEAGIVATAGTDCEPSNGRVFPAVFDKATAQDTLILFVNGGRASVKATLQRKGTAGVLGSTMCDVADDLAYNARCLLALTGVPDGVYDVEISTTNSLGGQKTRIYELGIFRNERRG